MTVKHFNSQTLKVKVLLLLLLAGSGCIRDIENPKISEEIYIYYEIEAPFDIPTISEYVFPNRDYNILDFGADESKDNTLVINEAIAKCNQMGGGRVIIPNGTFECGAIHLQSNVNLHLSPGAELLFNDNPSSYLPAVKSSYEGIECYNYSPLIYAYGCKNIAITGEGTLSAKMDTWEIWYSQTEQHLNTLKKLYDQMSYGMPVEERIVTGEENRFRPQFIQFNRCENVLLDGFKIRESPFWTIHMFMCNNGILRNLDVSAHGNNSDGTDIEMSSNFLIERCSFDQGDDAIVIKAGRNQDGWRLNKPSENIVIRNCEVITGHTLVAIGSECSAGVRNVFITDCKMPQFVNRLLFLKTNHQRGGFIHNITMENIDVENVGNIFEIDTDVLYQYRNLTPTYDTRITDIDGIKVQNITCKTAYVAIYDIKGDSRNPIKTVTLENIKCKQAPKIYEHKDNINNLNENNITIQSYN